MNTHKDSVSMVNVEQGFGKNIRIMLVDDHPLVRETLSRVLSTCHDMEVIGKASDGDEAIRMTREIVPDVILMDINMPNLNGLEATRIIHSEFPDIRIVGLSMNNGNGQSDAMMRAGASAYWPKNESIDLLLTSIRNEY